MEENYLSKTFLFLSLVIIGLLAISLVPTHVWRNLQLKQVDLLGDIKVTIDPKEQTKAWAAHVEDGIAALRNHRSLKDFALAL